MVINCQNWIEKVLNIFYFFSEDIAETTVAWYAWYYKPITVPASEIENIASLIPGRLDVLSQYLLNRKWAEYNVTNLEVMTDPHYIAGWDQDRKMEYQTCPFN